MKLNKNEIKAEIAELRLRIDLLEKMVFGNASGDLLESEKFLNRFWSKVDKRGENDCWEWLAGKNRAGYGRIRIKTGHLYAHKVSWELTNGPIGGFLHVCHKCDNPGCVNPNHLFTGTTTDNMKDKVDKLRHNFGERNGGAKLTWQKVGEIRAIGNKRTQTELAKMYGVSRKTIKDVLTEKKWVIRA